MTISPTRPVVNPPGRRKSEPKTLAPGTNAPAKGPAPIPEKSPPAANSGPPPPPKHQPTSPPRTQQPVIPPGTPKVPQSAHAIVNNFLAQYGLQSLGNWAWTRYAELGGGSNALQQISVEMTQQPAFLKRFPAYAKLAAEGEAMSPAEMVSYEETAKQVFHAAGIPEGFYDTPDELAQFMVNHVSTSELQSRVQLAQSAALTAPPDVTAQLKQLYGLNQGALTAYFINPTKALPLLQQQFTAAQIAAEGTRTGVGQLSLTQATTLAQQGVTDSQAAQGFGTLAQQQGLFQAQAKGEAPIDLNTQIAAQFEDGA